MIFFTSFRRRAGLLLAALVLLISPAAAAVREEFPGMNAKWRQFTSPNFELFSSAGERESRDLLRSLELVHATFLEFFRLKVRRPLPVTVFYFRDGDNFRAYCPAAYGKEHRFAGFYLHRADRAMIVTSTRDEWRQSQQTIFHEYVHHMFRVTEESPPTWYNEGVAELFSTLEESGKELHFGKAKPSSVADLQTGALLPLAEFFAVTSASPMMRDGRHTGRFYAQAWAMTHFVHLGLTKVSREKLERFTRLALSPAFAADPTRLRAACQEILGLDYPALSAQLQSYVRGGKYQWARLPVPPVPALATYERREVPVPEMRLRLAELLAHVDRPPHAKLALLEAAGRDPGDVRVQETLGMLAAHEGDVQGAQDRWNRALAAGSTNPAIHHELARIETMHLFASFDPYYRMPDETAARLRDLLARSLAQAPDQTAAYEMLAWVEGTASAPDVANVNRVQGRFPSLKKQDRTLLALALVRHRRDDNPAALQLLDELPKLEPDLWTRQGAERLRAKIEGRKPVLERGDPRRTGPRIVVPPPQVQPGGLGGPGH